MPPQSSSAGGSQSRTSRARSWPTSQPGPLAAGRRAARRGRTGSAPRWGWAPAAAPPSHPRPAPAARWGSRRPPTCPPPRQPGRSWRRSTTLPGCAQGQGLLHVHPSMSVLVGNTCCKFIRQASPGRSSTARNAVPAHHLPLRCALRLGAVCIVGQLAVHRCLAADASGSVNARAARRAPLQAGDNQHSTPLPSSFKGGPSVGGGRTGPAGATPFPNGFMPPLERLEENHYGGTPTGTVAAAAAALAAGVNANAGHTPGPRMGECMAAGAGCLYAGLRSGCEGRLGVCRSKQQPCLLAWCLCAGPPRLCTVVAWWLQTSSSSSMRPVNPSTMPIHGWLSFRCGAQQQRKRFADNTRASGPISVF